MSNNWIQTFTGKKFYPLDPRPEDIDILDIAHGLSMICRFNGQCSKFYSVAEHSVHIARKCPEDLILRGLLHDASEAYISDVGAPIKPKLYGYSDIENQLQNMILDKYEVTLDWGNIVKFNDRRILIDEQRQLMPNPPDDWRHVREPLGVSIECWSPERAEREFLEMFYSLYEGE